MGTKNKKTQSLLLLCMCVLIGGMLTACDKKTSYQYGKTELCDTLHIYKTEYKGDIMKLYCEGKYISSDIGIVCYDAAFQEMDADFTYNYKDGVLTIKADFAGQISGLKITANSYVYYMLRYLDSDQYAILYYYFADDLGYEEFGDREAYYTDEELARFEASKEKERKRKEEAFSYVEGDWISEDGTEELSFLKQDDSFVMKRKVYDAEADCWNTQEQMITSVYVNIDDDVTGVSVGWIDGPFDARETYFLHEDGTFMTCEFEDTKFVRKNEK